MKKLKNILYEFLRNQLKKEFTKNLGKVVEESDKIICYVDKNKIGNKKKLIICSGINDHNRVLANSYKLNKQIIYIFENLKIKNKIIYGYDNCDIIIKNCKFNSELNLTNNGNCIINDTYISSYNSLTLMANKINIKNSEIQNEFYSIHERLNISIYSNERIDIIDSKIGKKDDNTILSIRAKEAHILNSEFENSDINIKAPIFKSDENSKISGSNKISINSDKIEISKLNTPYLIINGEEITHSFDECSINSEISSIQSKRCEFIKLLKELKNQCNRLIEDDINKLYNEPISKKLTK